MEIPLLVGALLIGGIWLIGYLLFTAMVEHDAQLRK